MCKYRIAKKKIKSIPQLKLFIESRAEWLLTRIEACARQDAECVKIIDVMRNYDFEQIVNLANDNRIKLSHIKLFSYKTFNR